MLTLTKVGEKLDVHELDKIRGGWGDCGHISCGTCGTKKYSESGFMVDFLIWWASGGPTN
jgi:hypothetical protein